jgi:hypothetical protein
VVLYTLGNQLGNLVELLWAHKLGPYSIGVSRSHTHPPSWGSIAVSAFPTQPKSAETAWRGVGKDTHPPKDAVLYKPESDHEGLDSM